MLEKYGLNLDKKYHPYLVAEDGVTYSTEKVASPEEVVHMIIDCFHVDERAEEYTYLVACNRSNRVVAIFEMGHGTSNSCLMSPQQIFTRLLLCGGEFFIITHNHPSGDPEPSKEDKNMARRLVECGKLMEIPMMDFIITGENYTYYSFLRETDLIKE